MMDVYADAFASDDELDHALGIPTMRELLGRPCPITPSNFALPTEHQSSGRNRGGNASGSSSPGAPDYHHASDTDTDYETGDTMTDARTTHNR